MKTSTQYQIAGVAPRSVEMPTTQESLAQIVSKAAKLNLAIVPWGGGTMQYLGNSPRRYDIAIDLTQMNSIVEYTPDDLTITVQAGATIDSIQSTLAIHNQFLALDPALPSRATIGGTLAANATGPARLRYGTARDFSLGMSVVNAEGKITKSGGKVVKNVAGYELPKLHIGALGSLGIITQVTFKVFPKPPEQITEAATFTSLSRACNAVRSLWNLTTLPTAIEIFDKYSGGRIGLASDIESYIVAARFDGSKSVTNAARLKARELLREGDPVSIDMARGELMWTQVADLPETLRENYGFGAVLQIGFPPARLNATIEKIAEHVGATPHELFAHAATAIVYLAIDANEQELTILIDKLRTALASLEANVIVRSAPIGAKQKISVWGDPRTEHFMAQRLKANFDPDGIFNPGRFVGGL
jgi:glycolate oxidase FAD binding subunit